MWGKQSSGRRQKGVMESWRISTFSPLKISDAYPEHGCNIIQVKNTSVSMFISSVIHPEYYFQAFLCVFLALWCFTFTVTHLGWSGGYITAAGGGVPCLRVLDGFQRERRKWHLFLSHARFLNWTGTHVLTDSHISLPQEILILVEHWYQSW